MIPHVYTAQYLPKLDRAFGGVALLGLLAKFFHWPLSMLLLVGFGGLALANFAALFSAPAPTPEKQPILRVSRKIGHLGVALGAIGLLFFIELMPNYNQVLSLGLLVLWTALGIRFWYRNPDIPPFREYFMQKLAASAVLVLILAVIGPVPIQKIIHQDDPEMVRLIKAMDQHPGDEEIRKAFIEYQNSKEAE